MLRTLLSTTAYPATLLGAGVGMVALLDHGVEASVASALVAVVSGAVALALDRGLPYEASWARSHDDVGTDLAHTFLSGTVVEATRVGLFAAFGAAATWLSGEVGGSLWPVGWPLAVQVAVALIGMELFGYGFHRACHEVGVFWRLHAVHHSVPRLYVLNTFRLHPLDSILSLALQVAPLVLVGADARFMAVFLAVVFAHSMLQHSNADLRLGPLNWLFAGPELHRWHHSPKLTEQMTNYGTVMIVWDVVFGTRYLPAGRPPVDVGLGNMPDYPTGYVGQLASPFIARLWHPASASAEASPTPSSQDQEDHGHAT